jgi:toxin-antitoxin system PIN domain toxin
MPDVNILVYAHRSDDRDHRFYRGWLEQLINGPEPFALSALVAVAFVRIVTHPGFPPAPTPLPQALSVIEALRAHPGCRFLSPQGRHWALFRQIAECAQAAGKRIADAQHAALALEHGCTWTTRDRDFHAFEPAGLRVEILDPR